MLQHNRIGSGIAQYNPRQLARDTSSNSPDFFKVHNFPDTLYIGKNSFKLSGNLDNLAPKSLIYIDVVDSNGKVLYHEISNIEYNDGSLLVVVYLYHDIPPGDVSIYIAGRMKYDPDTRQSYPHSTDPASPNFIDIPNVYWAKQVPVILDKENRSKVVFQTPPRMTAEERVEEYLIYSSSNDVRNRLTTITGSVYNGNTLILNSVGTPYTFSNTTRFSPLPSEQKVLSTDPTMLSNTKVQSNTITLPKYTQLSRVQFNRLDLNKDYVGGQLIIRDLNSVCEGVPTDMVIPDFSCSIVNVVDAHTAEIYPSITSILIDNGATKYTPIINQSISNFTASYFAAQNAMMSSSTAVESFVELTFIDIEPLVGSIDSVNVYYKARESYGDFINVGKYKIREQNLLIDPTDVEIRKDGIGDKEIGLLSYPEFTDYWDIHANPLLFTLNSAFEAEFRAPITLDTGVSLHSIVKDTYSASFSTPSYYCYIRTNDQYLIQGHINTEYKLEFSSRYTVSASGTPLDNDPAPHQIDIYVSGTSVYSDIVHETELKPLIVDPELFGTYIGSISTHKTISQENASFYFKVLESKEFTPIFVVRSGNSWEIKNIKISPRNEFGYSPNQTKITIPITTLKTNSELILKVDYLNGIGEVADINTELPAVYFTGSGVQVDLPTGVISGSDQILSGSDILSSSYLENNGVLYYSGSDIIANPMRLRYSHVAGIPTLVITGSVGSDLLIGGNSGNPRLLLGTTNQWQFYRTLSSQAYIVSPGNSTANSVGFISSVSSNAYVNVNFGYGNLTMHSSWLQGGSSAPLGPSLNFTQNPSSTYNWSLQYFLNATGSIDDFDFGFKNNNSTSGSFIFRKSNDITTVRIQPLTGNITTSGSIRMISGSGTIGYTIVDIDGNGTFGWRPAASGSGPVDWVDIINKPVGLLSSSAQIATDISGAFPATASYALMSLSASWAPGGGVSDHGALTGLGDDDHTQYVLLAGRSGGQTIIGGTGTTDDVIIRATSGVGTTGSDVIIQVGNNGATEAARVFYNGNIGIGQPAPASKLVVSGTAFFGGINELVDPYSTYGVQNNGYIQIGKGIATSNLNANFPDVIFVHDLTSVSGDKIAGGFKFLNKSTGNSEKRIAQFFCWAENAVNKGAMSFYTNDGTNALFERLRIASEGKIGIGIYASLAAKFNVLSTTEQIRVMYDSSNYYTTTVGASGAVTFNAVGSNQRFIFSDRVNIPTHTPSSATDTGVTGDIAWDANYMYVCTATNTWKRTPLMSW